MQRTPDTPDTPSVPVQEQIRRGSITLTIAETKPMDTSQEIQSQGTTKPVVVNMKTKARQSHYPLVVAVSSLAWAIISLVLVMNPIHHTRSSISLQLRAAELEHQEFETAYDTQYMVERGLWRVESTYLQRRSFETHNGCLARAIDTAHKQYNGLPYENYPGVVNDTIEWAETSCGRHVFAPQIPTPRGQTKLEHSIVVVAEATARFYEWARSIDVDTIIQKAKSVDRESVVRGMDTVIQKAKSIDRDSVSRGMNLLKEWFASRMQRKVPLNETKTSFDDTVNASELDSLARLQNILREQIERRDKSIREAMDLPLPPHYIFQCREDAVCRLIHTKPTSDEPEDLRLLELELIDTLLHLSRRENFYAKICACLERIVLFLLFAQVKLMLAWAVVVAYTPRAHSMETMEKERHTFKILTSQLFTISTSILLCSCWTELNEFAPSIMSWLALAYGIMGFYGLIKFFATHGEDEDGFWNLDWAIRDLYKLWRPVVPEIIKKLVVAAGNAVTPPTIAAAPTAAASVTPPPPPPHRSPLFDDIELERVLMQQEKKEKTSKGIRSSSEAVWADKAEDAVDSSSTETETESESDILTEGVGKSSTESESESDDDYDTSSGSGSDSSSESESGFGWSVL